MKPTSKAMVPMGPRAAKAGRRRKPECKAAQISKGRCVEEAGVRECLKLRFQHAAAKQLAPHRDSVARRQIVGREADRTKVMDRVVHAISPALQRAHPTERS